MRGLADAPARRVPSPESASEPTESGILRVELRRRHCLVAALRIIVIRHPARKDFAQNALVTGGVEINAEDFGLMRPNALCIQLRRVDNRRIEVAVGVAGLNS